MTATTVMKNYESLISKVDCIDLVVDFDAILTSRQTREKLHCLHENLMSNNFRKTALLKKYDRKILRALRH